MSMADHNNKTIVLYPSPGRSHLVPMIELGKLILTHHPSFSITMIVPTFPNTVAGDTSHYIFAVSGITFHHLPTVSDELGLKYYPSIDEVTRLRDRLAELNNSNLRQTLLTLFKTSTLKALVIDFFCKAALQVSSSLNIPTYFFFTSGATALAQILHYPNLKNITDNDCFRVDAESEMLLDHIPGLPPIRAKEMFPPDDSVLKNAIDTAIQMTKSCGIIINTFETLEQRASQALKDGKCVPNGETMPPVYCLGPVLAATVDNKNDYHMCLSWLDLQPKQSVVFLCFGSMVFFSSKQLKEMAIGLERSRVRFLWVVLVPPPEDEFRRNLAVADAEVSVEMFLPEDFLERTRDRGLVVKSWAPQTDVLSHDSVGGFVTHCGWNSVIEALCAGVPMVAWPFIGDQMVNRSFLVEDIEVAVPVVESEDGLVYGAELEKRVIELMDSENGKGKVLRERTRALKEKAMGALREGGCSLAALAELATRLDKEWSTDDYEF